MPTQMRVGLLLSFTLDDCGSAKLSLLRLNRVRAIECSRRSSSLYILRRSILTVSIHARLSSISTEYGDDKAIVPRSTTVIARRLPPSRPGKGNAQNYMASTFSAPSATGPGSMNAGRKGNMSQRFDFRNEPPAKASVS